MTSQNNRAPVLCRVKLCTLFQSNQWIQVTVRKCSIRVKSANLLAPCELEIWRMILKSNRAPLLCYFKLCVSFHSHWSIQTGVTDRKRPIWVKIGDYFVPCDRQIWRMTLKNNKELFCATLSFVHHFIAIGKFKLELPSGNNQFGSKSAICRLLWPWKLTDDVAKE